jgi:steroid 5-alpha reductase family enzyme
MILVCLLAVLVAVSLLMVLAWWISARTGQSGFTDVTWTYGTGAAGVFLALAPLGAAPAPTARQILVAALVAVWSLRLGSHILARTLKGGDDPRYAKLKRDWGADASRRMFWFLQVQALTMALLGLAVAVAAHNPRPGLDWRDGLGAAIVAIGILGETLSDEQLKAFGRDPAHKGKVCDTGLWSWSRHPNYFFEFFGWLAYPVVAIGLASYPWGWLALVGPALIYWLLALASGIPPLEEHMIESRGDAFRAYQARTSAFFPRPPRRQGAKP